MTRSFALDDGGDHDTVVTVVLLAICFGLALVNFSITVPHFSLFPSPLIAFALTRWAYKRHFRIRRMSASHTGQTSL